MAAAPCARVLSLRLRSPLVPLAVCAVAAVACSGCGTTIKASEVPVHLTARPIENPQTLDLSRLAGRTIASDRIVAGDVLEVTLSAGLEEEDQARFKVRVRDDGIAQLPHIGELAVEGLELSAAEAEIAKLAIDEGVYNSPHVTVLMEEPKMHRVTVVGAVSEPDTVELRAGSADLLTAITAAGGLSEEAGTRVDIKLPPKAGGSRTASQRPLVAGMDLDGAMPGSHGAIQQTAYAGGDEYTAFENDIRLAGYDVQTTAGGGREVQIDLVSAVQTGRQGPRLPDGAVVSIEKRDPKQIYVTGLVNKPAGYDYPYGEELRLIEAVSIAGGLSNPAANKIYVIRRGVNRAGQTEHIVIKTSFQKAKFDPVENLVLMPGDEITVERTVATTIFDVFSGLGYGFSLGGL